MIVLHGCEPSKDFRETQDGLLKNYLNMVFNRLSVEREVTANAARDFNRLRSIKGYKVKPAEEAWLSNFHNDPKLSVSLIIDYGGTRTIIREKNINSNRLKGCRTL